MSLPSLTVSVVMRHEPVQGPMARWQPWRWVLADVWPAEQTPQHTRRCCIAETGVGTPAHTRLWLSPGLQVRLYPDEAEGYHLNLTTERPCVWVMWRLIDVPDEAEAEPVPIPQAVTLSYNEAGRWLDAQETVERVDAPADMVAWLQAFTEQHHQPEPKRRKRPDSFKPLSDRFGNPVRISTDKLGPRPGGPT
jgi:hypothetical protein